ncbi:hypothetical protein ACSAZK_16315 [Methanosarcina sp. Mfa9]|uniref:hypothetical protein n=1 Tax=Methanosarcina sp. Mfa9 TaxID=3439063 RepID=UPI003F833C1B
MKQAQEFVDVEKIKGIILSLTPDEAREIGIKYRSTLNKLKNRVTEGDFNLNTKVIKKILEHSFIN